MPNRRSVGQYVQGQTVKVKDLPGEWEIVGFPSRRTAKIALLRTPPGITDVVVPDKVPLLDLTVLQR